MVVCSLIVCQVICGSGGTPYEGGQFKVRLQLTSDFPSAPPKGFFLTKIFHPNVSKAGDICVNTLKKDWNEKLGIRHVLLTIKCLLIHPNPESALNEEAGKLLLEDYDEYAKQARLMTTIHASRKLVEKTSSENEPREKSEEQKPRAKNDENVSETLVSSQSLGNSKKIKTDVKKGNKNPPALAKKKTLKRL